MRNFKLGFAAGLIILAAVACQADFDVMAFQDNFDGNDNQLVLYGGIDNLSIIRANFEFHLSKGNLTILDFGSGIPCGLVFDGHVLFRYTPPDEIERYQLNKFTGKDILESEFDTISFFFTIDSGEFLDTAGFARMNIGSDFWKRYREAQDYIFKHVGIYMPNRLLWDLKNDGPGSFFCADFSLERFEHLVFIEDPLKDDWYQLYKLTKTAGRDAFDVYAGFSYDKSLPSRRGFNPIDIVHYEISSVLDGKGKMTSECRINYIPIVGGKRYLYFDWFYKNEPLAAFDSKGDTLQIVHRDDEPGFGIAMKEPLPLGDSDYVDIKFKCNSMINDRGVFFISGKTYWYPKNPVWDRAAFELTYDYPDNYEIVSSGELTETKHEEGRLITQWACYTPMEYFSFNYGIFNSKEILSEGLPDLNVYMAKNIPHEDLVDYFNYFGELSTKDMMGAVASDVRSSILFLTNLLGPCPFNTIKCVETVGASGQGSPGLIHYTWLTYQFEDQIINDSQFRAHEVAHQWWGHIVDFESYSDIWITEGLAQYSGFLYLQPIAVDPNTCENVLKEWRRAIIDGSGGGSMGTKAGPIILGYRLNSSKSDDYSTIVYDKGAYVFHMIRYLMYDFKTNSDAAFKDFLTTMLEDYRYKPIDTAGLQRLLEETLQVDMSWFFNQWVYGIDIPTYEFSYDTEKNDEGKYVVTCHVTEKDVPDNFMMMVPITVVFSDDQYAPLELWVDKPENDIVLPALPLKPKKIDFNTYGAVLCNVRYK